MLYFDHCLPSQHQVSPLHARKLFIHCVNHRRPPQQHVCTWKQTGCWMSWTLNCLRKRSSWLQNSRMSGMLYRTMASLSRPRPNAQPALFPAPATKNTRDNKLLTDLLTYHLSTLSVRSQCFQQQQSAVFITEHSEAFSRPRDFSQEVVETKTDLKESEDLHSQKHDSKWMLLLWVCWMCK